VATKAPDIEAKAESEGWILAQSFKRYMHRVGKTVTPDRSGDDVPELPEDVTVGTLYRDWLIYLIGHAKDIFIHRHSSAIWDELSPELELIMAVPNGWYTQEQGVLDKAAVAARVVRDGDKVSYVPETDAAVHWAWLQRAIDLEVGCMFL